MTIYDYIDNLLADGVPIASAQVSLHAASEPLYPYRGVKLAAGSDENLTAFFDATGVEVAKVLWLEPVSAPPKETP